jgi:protein-disulfide isomerase
MPGLLLVLRHRSAVLGLLAALPLVAAAESVHQGVPAGFTPEGHAFVGAADAPVTLEEWNDYACPFCQRYARDVAPQLLADYVRPGRLRIVLRDLPLDKLHPTAKAAHVAARCAGEQGADRYWALHDLLFARQGEWAPLPDPAQFLTTAAAGLGVNVERYRACVDRGEAASAVGRDLAEARDKGYHSTPAFRLLSGGRELARIEGAQPLERFAQVIDALLAGEEPPAEPKPEPALLPRWARPEGLAPDPARPGYTLAGDAYKGNPDASVVVIEFTDFQCPACRKHQLEVQPGLDERWVRPGRALWVSKHLPLRVHPQSALAAVAAECAGEQGRFWEMHDRLFARQDDWPQGPVEQKLKELAEELRLNRTAFARCLDGRRALERVLADLWDAQGVVERVPTFVVLNRGTTGSLAGPLTPEAFDALLANAENEARARRLPADAGSQPRR